MFLHVSLTLLLFGAACCDCPPGSDYISQMDICLVAVNNGTAYGFNQAQLDCLERGGRLTSIQNGFENSLIVQFSIEENLLTSAYIGAHIENGEWIWTDGKNMSYTNWAPGQPTEQGSCGALNMEDGKWYSTNCNQNGASYMCSLKPIGPTPSTPPGTSCSSGWTLHDDNCYFHNYTFPNEYNWDEARQFCLSSGGDLASIHSQEENDFVAKLSINSNCYFPWIGLQWDGADYSWSDGSTVDFSKAFEHEQEPPSAYFVYTCYKHFIGLWNDLSKTVKMFAFVCKKPGTVVDVSLARI